MIGERPIDGETLLEYTINSQKIAAGGLKKIDASNEGEDYWKRLKGDQKIKRLLIRYIKLGREACLLASNFKCQRCGKDKRLQFHHLILRHMKKTKKYIEDPLSYSLQRNYWANIVILCPDCHAENHSRERPDEHKIAAKLIVRLKGSRERYAKRKGI